MDTFINQYKCIPFVGNEVIHIRKIVDGGVVIDTHKTRLGKDKCPDYGGVIVEFWVNVNF